MEKKIQENVQQRLLKDILDEIKKLHRSTIYITPENKIIKDWISETKTRHSLNLTKKQLSNLVQEQKIGCSNIGGVLFFKLDDLKQFMNDCYKPSKKKCNEK